MSRSHSAPRLRISVCSLGAGALLVTVALWLSFGARPAAAAGFHSCASQKLENQSIFRLKASHAKCQLARHVAFGLRNGDRTRKGFSCVAGEGGNLTPFTCSRRDQVVKFSLEG